MDSNQFPKVLDDILRSLLCRSALSSYQVDCIGPKTCVTLRFSSLPTSHVSTDAMPCSTRYHRKSPSQLRHSRQRAVNYQKRKSQSKGDTYLSSTPLNNNNNANDVQCVPTVKTADSKLNIHAPVFDPHVSSCNTPQHERCQSWSSPEPSYCVDNKTPVGTFASLFKIESEDRTPSRVGPKQQAQKKNADAINIFENKKRENGVKNKVYGNILLDSVDDPLNQSVELGPFRNVFSANELATEDIEQVERIGGNDVDNENASENATFYDSTSQSVELGPYRNVLGGNELVTEDSRRVLHRRNYDNGIDNSENANQNTIDAGIMQNKTVFEDMCDYNEERVYCAGVCSGVYIRPCQHCLTRALDVMEHGCL